MNKFSELLDTDLQIEIELIVEPTTFGQLQVWINDRCIFSNTTQEIVKISSTIPVLNPVEIKVHGHSLHVQSLKFDGWQARPTYGTELSGLFHFDTESKPFYQWQHHATGQGWLLEPQI